MLSKKYISKTKSDLVFQRTILLVEDEPITAQATVAQLKNRGYQVIHVRSGEAAIKEMKVNKHIDMIAMDIDLGPGMDGTTAAAQILKDHDIPLLFLSSHTETEIVEKTEQITNYGYVVKNSNITVLDASIKMAFKLFESKMNEYKKEEELIKTINILEERTHLSESITNYMYDIAALTSITGNIYWISRSNDLLGYEPDELVGKNIFDYVHPDDKQRIIDAFQEALRTKTDGSRVELRLRHKNGEYQWYETFGKFTKGKLVFSSRNIEERKEAVKTIKLLLRQFQHQTKNNLNQIIGILELMKDTIENSAQESLIQDIQGRLHAFPTIYDLLYRTSDDLKHIDLAAYVSKLANSILKTFNHAAKHIKLRTKLEPAIINAEYVTELRLILSEVLTNSLKYAYPDQRQGEVYIEFSYTGRQATLIIVDNGIGLPDQEIIFNQRSLGMSLVSSLVEAIGGTIVIEDNQPGVKTTLRFPIHLKK